MKKILIAATTLACLSAAAFVVYSQSRSCSEKDAKAYDGRIQKLKGKVTILNHSKLGKAPGSGMYLVFRREDCENCLVATRADSEGNYELFVGIGRYKFIVQDPRCDYGGTGCDCYNMLDPNQREHVNVERGPYDTTFDINIKLKK